MTIFYQTSHLLRRAFGGMRRRPWLHVLSIATLAAAFLSFAATLTAATNLDKLLDQWMGTAEITVYLNKNSTAEDLAHLSNAIKKLDGVESVRTVSSSQAKNKFAADLGTLKEMGRALPESAFPASVEVHLLSSHAKKSKARTALAARLSKVKTVESVEIYDEWFERLFALSSLGKAMVWGLGLLALVVAVLVTAATIRSGVSARRKEIQILRSVGATERYVRLPFLMEGALEAAVAMTLAQAALYFSVGRVDAALSEVLPFIGVGSIARLTTFTVVAMLIGGAVTGVVGARLSLRHLEER